MHGPATTLPWRSNTWVIPNDAVSGYQRAIDIDPALIDAYINLGNLYGELGMQEESLETFQQALEYDPDNDSALSQRGGYLSFAVISTRMPSRTIGRPLS